MARVLQGNEVRGSLAWHGLQAGGPGVGYYRDKFKLNLRLVDHITAEADAAPVTVKLEFLSDKTAATTRQNEEPDTYPRRKRTSTGRRSNGEGLDIEWPSDDSLAANSTFHVAQGQ